MIGLFQYRHGALRPADAHTMLPQGTPPVNKAFYATKSADHRGPASLPPLFPTEGRIGGVLGEAEK
jgi:hypothetical protein